MSLKFQLSPSGAMQSMYTLAWNRGTERTANDPIFAAAVVADEVDHDEMLLETPLEAPRRAAPLEEVVRSRAERRRVLERREYDLMRLGYRFY
jgi:hypothetical protein